MSSSTDSSFWKEQASATRPGNSSRTNARISSAERDSTSAGSCRLVAKQDLLQRVAAQTKAERLERDHFVGRDVAEVHVRTEVLDEPRVRRLRRRLPDEVVEVDLVRDLVDEPGAPVPVLAEAPGRAALAGLGDHLPRAGVLLFLDPLHPLVGREDDVGILRADLGEDDEVAREVLDELELAVARDLDGAVADLDVLDAEVGEPLFVLVDLA